MIDADLIQAITDPTVRQHVKDGFIWLGESGVLEQQATRLLAQLAHGASTESDASIVDKIRAYRTNTIKLQALKALGTQFLAEK